MSISELGSLGEFVGSMAVVATLVILIFQVRGARTEISSQMTREIKRHNNETFHQLTRHPDLVDIHIHIRAQRQYESLSEAEKLTWIIWLFTWINQTEDGWMARKRGIPNMSWVDSYVLGVALALRSDGGREVWPRLRVFFEPAFAEALEEIIRQDGSTFLDVLLGAPQLEDGPSA
ncbi:MAG: hypothetical protein ACX98W_04950 [bacterium]